MVLIGGNNVNHPAEPDVLRQLYTINSSSLSGRTIPDYMSMEYSGSVRIRGSRGMLVTHPPMKLLFRESPGALYSSVGTCPFWGSEGDMVSFYGRKVGRCVNVCMNG